MARQPRPFYVKWVWADWDHATKDLDPFEYTAYHRLLSYAASEPDLCSVPDDDRRLARAAGLGLKRWRSVRRRVLDMWFLRGDCRYEHPRLRKDADAWLQHVANQRKRGSRNVPSGAPDGEPDGTPTRARAGSRESQSQIKEESKDAPSRAGSQANGNTDPHNLARDLAANLGMPAPSDAASWGFDASLVDRRFSRLPGDRQRELRGIAGWLWKTGTRRMDVVLRLIEHLQATRTSNPYALLAEGSERRLDLEAKAREKIAADEKRQRSA